LIRVPTLFVHGTSDPFGAAGELAAARALIRTRTSALHVDGGHDLGWTAKRGDEQLPERIVAAFLDLVGPS